MNGSVYTCAVVRYWSKVVQSTTCFPLSDIEVKVIDLEIGVLLKYSDGIRFHNAWYKFNLCLIQACASNQTSDLC